MFCIPACLAGDGCETRLDHRTKKALPHVMYYCMASFQALGAVCIQNPLGDPRPPSDPEAPNPSEDCLQLNIWRPVCMPCCATCVCVCVPLTLSLRVRVTLTLHTRPQPHPRVHPHPHPHPHPHLHLALTHTLMLQADQGQERVRDGLRLWGRAVRRVRG